MGVKLKGGISACHRLRNNKRVIIKFQDLDDRSMVYDAKFQQKDTSQGKITIHENLTAKRAKQIQVLGNMWENNQICNYHTKNGTIQARKTREQRYTPIRADMSREEILQALEQAPLKINLCQGQAPNKNFLKSQTLHEIPQGRVAGQRADLEEFVITRSKGSGSGRGGRGGQKRGSGNH